MKRIAETVRRLKEIKKKAFVAYVTAGFPDLRTTEAIVRTLADNGADMVELGMPFSDPVADGPTIQHASSAALAKGITLDKYLGLVRTLRKSVNVPLIMMSYYNPVYKYGIKKFAQKASACGLDAAIIPDLPCDEDPQFKKCLEKEGLVQIFLSTPVTTVQRAGLIAKNSSGFIYYVSLTGVTGAREQLPSHIAAEVRRLKKLSPCPVFVGFGVSRPAQVRTLSGFADGVIVGSAIVKIIREAGSKTVLKNKLGAYVRQMNKMTYC